MKPAKLQGQRYSGGPGCGELWPLSSQQCWREKLKMAGSVAGKGNTGLWQVWTPCFTICGSVAATVREGSGPICF